MTHGVAIACTFRCLTRICRCLTRRDSRRLRWVDSEAVKAPDTLWELVFLMVILKIPIAYLCYVVWYAIKAEPRGAAALPGFA
jgi:hypothetical protein